MSMSFPHLAQHDGTARLDTMAVGVGAVCVCVCVYVCVWKWCPFLSVTVYLCVMSFLSLTQHDGSARLDPMAMGVSPLRFYFFVSHNGNPPPDVQDARVRVCVCVCVVQGAFACVRARVSQRRPAQYTHTHTHTHTHIHTHTQTGTSQPSSGWLEDFAGLMQQLYTKARAHTPARSGLLAYASVCHTHVENRVYCVHTCVSTRRPAPAFRPTGSWKILRT